MKEKTNVSDDVVNESKSDEEKIKETAFEFNLNINELTKQQCIFIKEILKKYNCL